VIKQRFKEIFKNKVSEFREACYLLTGYKVEMKQEGHFRLKSMYAEKEEDSLAFKKVGESLDILETDFLSRVDKETMDYMRVYRSIPAFLSQITLQLFLTKTRTSTTNFTTSVPMVMSTPRPSYR